MVRRDGRAPTPPGPRLRRVLIVNGREFETGYHHGSSATASESRTRATQAEPHDGVNVCCRTDKPD